MKRDPKALLWDALRAADAIAAMIAGKTLVQFEADIVLHSAVKRQFEVIGEALAQLASADPKIAELIPMLGEIIAFRNFLIHAYALVDRVRVWEIAMDDLPGLRTTLNDLLPRDEEPP